jgi:hypothetical protein
MLLHKCASQPKWDCLKKNPSEISASEHHILGAASGHTNSKKILMMMHHGKSVHYILKAYEENVPTSSATVQFVTDKEN